MPRREWLASYVCFFRSRAAADDLEDRDRLGFAFDENVAERTKLIRTAQPLARRIADDNPSAVLLVERFEPRSQVDRVANHRVAHDRVRPDVAGNHRPRVDADADVERRTSF